MSHPSAEARALLARWHAALPSGAEWVDAANAARRLLSRWNEPHRHYHTVTHLVSTLDVIDEHASLAGDPDAVRLAAWFHDAVYDPQHDGNEERSADLAIQTLTRLGLGNPQVAEVARLIRLTAKHECRKGDRDGGLLVDADLAVLAAPWEVYSAYTRAVRQEYQHLSELRFRSGRTSVVTRLIETTPLYRCLPHRDAMTTRARENLRRELYALGGP